MRIGAALFCALAIVSVLGGCKQQATQWGQGSGGSSPVVAPPSTVKSPDEVRQLENMARQNPGNVNAWIALGNARMDAQHFADAIVAYQRALELDPKNVDVRVDMGTCYRGVGQPEKALEEYRRALKLKPNHPNANRNSGVVLAFDLNRKAEGIKAFEKYLDIYPNTPDAVQVRQIIEELRAGK